MNRTGYVQSDGDYLTLADAADHLGISTKTLIRWDKAGKVSSLRTLGGHRRYLTEEIVRIKRVMSDRGTKRGAK